MLKRKVIFQNFMNDIKNTWEGIKVLIALKYISNVFQGF